MVIQRLVDTPTDNKIRAITESTTPTIGYTFTILCLCLCLCVLLYYVFFQVAGDSEGRADDQKVEVETVMTICLSDSL